LFRNGRQGGEFWATFRLFKRAELLYHEIRRISDE
jgi:hypothetical protein